MDKSDIELLEVLSDPKKYPRPKNRKALSRMEDLAQDSLNEGTITGYLAAILLYQQVTEELVKNLFSLSNLILQAGIWPAKIQFIVSKRMSFGQLIQKLGQCVEFDEKAKLLESLGKIAEIRNRFAHRIVEFNDEKEILSLVRDFDREYTKTIPLYRKAESYYHSLLSEHTWAEDFFREY